MPYNIDPPCPGQTRITWQVPNQLGIASTQGDDYKIDITPENPFVIYYLRVWYKSGTPGGWYNPPVNATFDDQGRVASDVYLSQKPANDATYSHVEVTSFYRDPVNFRYNEPQYYLTYVWRLKNGGTTSPVIKQIKLPYQNFGSVSDDKTEVITKNTPYEPAYYNVKILKNNQVVYTSPTYTILPQVSWECLGGCPPGTCQVDCGSVYCCYGSDGIAVSSFSK